MSLRITATRDDNTSDITEGVKVLYDSVVGSLDWGSGFLDHDEVVRIIELAVTCGFTQHQEAIDAYVKGGMPPHPETPPNTPTGWEGWVGEPLTIAGLPCQWWGHTRQAFGLHWQTGKPYNYTHWTLKALPQEPA